MSVGPVKARHPAPQGAKEQFEIRCSFLVDRHIERYACLPFQIDSQTEFHLRSAQVGDAVVCVFQRRNREVGSSRVVLREYRSAAGRIRHASLCVQIELAEYAIRGINDELAKRCESDV